MITKHSPEAANLGAGVEDAAGGIDASSLTEAAAARLTTKIQLRLTTIADNVEAVLPLIKQARVGDAHLALGYRSWTEFVSDKFGGALARLGRAQRLPVVELLSDQGMSTRAIASVVGVSKSQVAADVSSSGHLDGDIVGTDGKVYPRPAVTHVPAQTWTHDGENATRAAFRIPATVEEAAVALEEIDAEQAEAIREAAEQTVAISRALQSARQAVTNLIIEALTNKITAAEIVFALMTAQRDLQRNRERRVAEILRIGVFTPLIDYVLDPDTERRFRPHWDHDTFLPYTDEEHASVLASIASLGLKDWSA